MQEFGEKVDKVSGKVNNIGNELTTKLTVPVVGLGTVAMTTGANLEQAIDKYIATTEKSTEETEKYKKSSQKYNVLCYTLLYVVEIKVSGYL